MYSKCGAPHRNPSTEERIPTSDPRPKIVTQRVNTDVVSYKRLCLTQRIITLPTVHRKSKVAFVSVQEQRSQSLTAFRPFGLWAHVG